jgi:hypothetical protein
MIYFVHVPKTAGISMQRLFADNRHPEAVGRVYLPPSLTVADLPGLPADRIRRLEVLYGHYPYGVDTVLGKPGIYLTNLRETRSRLFSSYFHHMRGGMVADQALLDYVQTWKPKDFDNYTVRLLCGVGEDIPFGTVTNDHLRQAKENLTDRFKAFGLYEYLPQSIEILCRAANINPATIDHENVRLPEFSNRAVDPGELDAVVRHNALDDELYVYAKALFLKRLG